MVHNGAASLNKTLSIRNVRAAISFIVFQSIQTSAIDTPLFEYTIDDNSSLDYGSPLPTASNSNLSSPSYDTFQDFEWLNARAYESKVS